MGCAFSSAGALQPCAGVRVIHTNGYVEDFHGPGVITVAHVTGGAGGAGGGGGGHHNHNKASSAAAAGCSPPRHVLCSAQHLLQPGRGPFRPDDALQPGTVYFLLPQTVFQSESSAVDLACLMNRLTALARRGCATAAPKSSPLEAFFAAHHHSQSQQQKEDEEQQQQQPVPMPPKAAKEPWRPRLDRIDESIGRASMSVRSSASSRSACSCSEA